MSMRVGPQVTSYERNAGVPPAARQATTRPSQSPQIRCEFSARNCDLLAGGQMLEREGIGLHFVLAYDKDVSRSHLVGGLEGFFQAKRFIAEIDDQIVPRAVRGPRARLRDSFRRRAEQCKRRACGQPTSAGGSADQRKHQPVFSDGKADSRGRRAAERFGQAVVSAAAEDRILRAERAVREFKCGAGVVIEAAHQARVLDVGNSKTAFRICFTSSKWVRQSSSRNWLMVGRVSMMGWSSGTLQSKTRSGLVTARRWQSAHILPTTGASALLQGFVEFYAVGGAAHGVEFERPVPDADAVEQAWRRVRGFRRLGRGIRCRTEEGPMTSASIW